MLKWCSGWRESQADCVSSAVKGDSVREKFCPTIDLGVRELRRLRHVEGENSRLKWLVADLSLGKHMLSEALREEALSSLVSFAG